jgi:hypothetical protein
MCLSAPKIKPPPPPAQMQSMQQPKDMTNAKGNSNMLRRRGMWASIFTGPQGSHHRDLTGSGISVTGHVGRSITGG